MGQNLEAILLPFKDKLSAIAKAECLSFTVLNAKNEVIFSTEGYRCRDEIESLYRREVSPGALLNIAESSSRLAGEICKAQDNILIYGFKYGLLVCELKSAHLSPLTVSTLVNLLSENLRLLIEQNEKDQKLQLKEEELARQRRELFSFYRVYQALGIEMELETLLDRILRAIQKALKTEIGSLYLMDEESGMLVPRVVTGEEAAVLRPVNLGESITGWVARTGQPEIINDLPSDPRFTNPLHRSNLKAQLCTPIKIKGKVIGVINVFNREDEEGFTQEDLRLLSVFTTQMAVAIERARLYENEQLKLKRLTMLYELERVLHTSVDFNTLTLQIVKKLGEMAQMEYCLLYLLDENRKEYMLHARAGGYMNDMDLSPLPVACGIIRRVLVEKKPAYLENCMNRKALPHLPETMRHLMLFPLIIKDNVLGVVVFSSRINSYLSTDQRQMLELMISQVANALERAILYRDLQKNINNLQALLDMDKENWNIINEEAIIMKVLEKALQLPTVKFGQYMSAEYKQGEKIVYQYGDDSLIEEMPEIKNGFTRSKPYEKGRLTGDMEYLALPLSMGDNLLGLCLFYCQGKFAELDVNFLILLVKQSAAAIENARLYKMLREEYLSMIQSLAYAIEAKDPYTMGHSERVERYALMIGQELGLNAELLDNLRIAAILHDVGKIGVDERILGKPGELTEEEYEIVKKHPLIAQKILKPQESTLGQAIQAVVQHHERIDGKGYPAGGNGEISMLARILAVADAYDAMTSHRPYRPPYTHEKAVSELIKCSHSQFDARIVENFLKALAKRSPG
ncbi:MAG: GAF domain-containing protein [Bacillota bacterium]